ncbi:dihydrofolate reductase family protein [Kribbella albertanoniae]|uniref:Dihydrofolate reductase n=1 Tax=Kribbella albertanoniae TaxID=1266829 RepID=A0A4R4P7E3_9ACTN|nr:dihydrofolate reductase family protein [Kribbella albertanoniae]TDC16793.1 dihydrofolate reductase [Kribbella albertanoniae]
MAKLLYSVTMSADGFIAGPNGDMQWMRPYLGPNPEVDELIPRIGSILVGRRSHDGDDPHKGEPGEGEAFGGGWDGPLFVVTHRPPSTPEPGVTYVDQLPKAIAAAKAAAGDKYVNVIGADIARQCIAAGELDEVLLIVAPVFLGDGTRVFDEPGGQTVRLRARSTTAGTNLWFDVLELSGRAHDRADLDVPALDGGVGQ